MEITSLIFVILAITAILIFYIIPTRYRTGYLVVLGLLFIVSYSIPLLFYITAYSFFNYRLGLQIKKTENKKTLYITGIVVNLCQLALLKYHSFLFDPILSHLTLGNPLPGFAKFIIPVGISFFTLQGIGYIINVYKGWEQPEKNFLHFLLFITFFPKFLSGPVERSNKFLPQLKNHSGFEEKQVTEGLRIALTGFFKKIVIANQLGSIVMGAYANGNMMKDSPLWLVLFIQPFYLYFDFSGYTDIAIGFSKAFGLKLTQNFDRPFFAENVSTFWRRWHMSLTTWFNEYVFRQVSFRYRRWGNISSVMAVFITFTLFGIWHGAGWNFMILGFIQAIAIIYEYFTKPYRVKFFSVMPDFGKRWLSRICTFCFFAVSLVFFFSPDLTTALDYFGQLFSKSAVRATLNLGTLLALFFAFVFILLELLDSDYKNFKERLMNRTVQNGMFKWAVYYIMIVLILKYLSGNEAFIYQLF